MKASQLRASILQQAVEGKLVPQIPEEGTAADLLESIRAEREALIKAGKIKKAKPLPKITEDEIPFEIPESWEWVRLGDVGEYKKGPFGSALTKSLFVPKSIDTIKVYEQKNAIKKDASLGEYYITREYFESNMRGFEVFSGDIIVSCAGTIGETFILPAGIERGIINQALMRMTLSSSLDKDYFLLYFESILKGISQKAGKGSALKNIPPFSIFKNLLLALPPLAEQKRIVAKVEELMPLIDAYEKEEEKLSALEKSLPEKLRRSVLQQAVEGKLVPQIAEEGTAAELLKEIEKERAELIKAGKMKKAKPLPEISEEEIPFEIPESWQWVRLGDIINLISGRDLEPQDYTNKECGIPYLTGASNISSGVINIERWTEYPQVIAERGDLLLSCKGTVGKTVIQSIDKLHIARQIMSLRVIKNLDVAYLKIFIDNSVNILINEARSMIPGISREHVLPMLFPLPPLAEQKRIVAKVEELMQIIDKL